MANKAEAKQDVPDSVYDREDHDPEVVRQPAPVKAHNASHRAAELAVSFYRGEISLHPSRGFAILGNDSPGNHTRSDIWRAEKQG